MIFECWAIVIVVFAISIILLRQGRKDYALATLPIVIVPLAHVMAPRFGRWLNSVASGFVWQQYYLMIVLVAVVLTCVLSAVATQTIAGKTARRAYRIICVGFSLILTIILVFRTISFMS